jgi:hypothetical protein
MSWRSALDSWLCGKRRQTERDLSTQDRVCAPPAVRLVHAGSVMLPRRIGYARIGPARRIGYVTPQVSTQNRVSTSYIKNPIRFPIGEVET